MHGNKVRSRSIQTWASIGIVLMSLSHAERGVSSVAMTLAPVGWEQGGGKFSTQAGKHDRYIVGNKQQARHRIRTKVRDTQLRLVEVLWAGIW